MQKGSSVKLVVYHPVPSLNKLFAMNPWQRRKEKKTTQCAFRDALSASQATEGDYLTLITLREAASIFSIAVNIHSLSTTTGPKTSSSKCVRRKSPAKALSALKS